MSSNELCHRQQSLPARRGDDAANPVHYEVDPKRKLVVVRFGCRVSASDIARYAEQLRTHPRFRPTFAEIVDLRNAREVELQAKDFIALADQIDPFSVDAKRAFVVQTTVQRHAARMHKILHGQHHFEVFSSLEAAEAWVGR